MTNRGGFVKADPDRGQVVDKSEHGVKHPTWDEKVVVTGGREVVKMKWKRKLGTQVEQDVLVHLDARLFRVDGLFKMSERSNLVFFGERLAESKVESMDRVKPRDNLRKLGRIQLAEDRQDACMGGGPREDVIWNSMVLWLDGVLRPA